ncbi:MAG TPA: hypothetical protein G4O16_02450, partial [Dehalococcoidia bacterium]|nr:hypothetical protein [Dehalococcoidia bacterium]
HLGTSRNCRGGMVVSGFLVEVAPVDLDELRKKYPEAFSRPYHQASGLHFDRVLA